MSRYTGWIGSMVFAVLAATGCDGDEVVCGEGTHDEGGICVPDSQCGEGTVWDASTRSCIPDYRGACAEGTVYDEAVDGCLPDYDALCPQGWIFDESLQECVPAEVDYEEAPEDNDPLSGGTPLVLGLPAVGETITIGGAIGVPTVVDGPYGDEPYADFDVVEFAATKGQVLRLEGTSFGTLASVAFLLAPSDRYSDTPTSVSPLRFGMALDSRNPVRFVRILEDATYWLFISDKDNLAGLEATGGDDMRYVVAISSLQTPADQTAALGTAFSDDLLDEPALHVIDGAAANMVLALDVAEPLITGRTRRHLMLLDGTDSIVRVMSDTQAIDLFSGATVILPMDSERLLFDRSALKLFVDYEIYAGTDVQVGLQVSALTVDDLGTIGATSGPVSRTGVSLETTEDAANVYRFDLDAADGALVQFTFDDFTAGSDYVPVAMFKNGDYTSLNYLIGTEQPSKTVFFEDGTNYFEVFNYYLDVGSYTYDFTVDFAAAMAAVVPEVEPNETIGQAQGVAVATLPVKVAGSIDDASALDYFSITPSADGSFTFYGYGPTADLSLTLYDDGGTPFAQADQNFGPWEEILTTDLTGGQTYYVEVMLWQYGTYDYALVIAQ